MRFNPVAKYSTGVDLRMTDPATMLLLTGCVKLDVDLTVGDNDTVSGTYVIAVDRSVLQLTGQDADQFYDQLASEFDTSGLPEGASAEIAKYDRLV